MPFDRELQAALEAARLAGRAVLDAYASFERLTEARADISTAADRQSQDIILRYLAERFPGDAFCAEEATPELAGRAQTGPRQWVIDPIDGTRGFALKNGEFSVMVAFVADGQVMVGVVLEPVRRRVTYAVRGGGCWIREVDDEPYLCQVTTTAELAAATLTQSHSKPGQTSEPVQRLKPARVIETYSAGVKLALVARGEADLYVNTYAAFHDWDIAAGQILVEEAGGTVTGLHGETLRYGVEGAWQRHGLLASNGALHEAALRAG
jgi:3'(2'), 5'-bisphosphate nucleotidase